MKVQENQEEVESSTLGVCLWCKYIEQKCEYCKKYRSSVTGK